MKKVKACAFAVAAMTMAMVSCNKEEAVNHESLLATVEQNEAIANAKTHFVGSEQFWDNGDRVSIWDASGRGSYWHVNTVDGANVVFVFDQDVNTSRPFDEYDGDLVAYYPLNAKANRGYYYIPAVQTSAAGEMRGFPMYGEGPHGQLKFKNICSIVRLNVKGDMAIDSVSITTDKKMNGKLTMQLTENDLLTSVSAGNNGTNVAMLKFDNALQLNTTTATPINMYVPAGEYKYFNITFYSNGTARTIRNTADVTLIRSNAKTLALTLNSGDFDPFYYGTTGAEFSLGDGQTCYVAKGNLTYVGGVGANYCYWRIADHGFACVGTQQFGANGTADRDAFCWGANGYVYQGSTNLWGNLLKIHNVVYSTDNVLSGLSDWANNNKRNADLNLNWMTPSQAQMTALLSNNHHFAATVLGVNGVVLVPAGVNNLDETVASLTKEQWNAYEAAGCAFFPNAYRRNNKATANGSFYWTSTGVAGQNNAYAWNLNDVVSTAKNTSCFVRMIALAE